jgi:hypothetical protein
MGALYSGPYGSVLGMGIFEREEDGERRVRCAKTKESRCGLGDCGADVGA